MNSSQAIRVSSQMGLWERFWFRFGGMDADYTLTHATSRLSTTYISLTKSTNRQEENAMTTDEKPAEQPKQKVVYRNGSSAPIYGMGFLGALVYYISHATTFWLGVLGIFKAIFWPAMLVYELLKYLNM
jgi:hypothetical protein